MTTPCNVALWRCPRRPHGVVEVLQSHPHLLSYLTDVNFASGVEECPSAHQRLFVLFPGNPGLVNVYQAFCKEMWANGFDVIVMGYAGHSLTDHNQGRLFTLQDQLEVADHFMATVGQSEMAKRRYTNNIYIGGHSIGGFVALHMLARYQTVKRGFGICPVLSRIQESPNGKRLSFVNSGAFVHWVCRLVICLLLCLPTPVRAWVIERVARDVDTDMRGLLVTHLTSTMIMNVVHMARDEFRTVLHPDKPLLTSVQERLALYYVPSDGWAPINFAEEIHKLCPRLAGFAVEKQHPVTHAWCLAHSAHVVQNAVLPFMKR